MLNEMPKRCADCKFKDSGTNYMCHATEDVIICDIDKEIDSNCPLIEINDNIAKLIEVAR